MKDVAVVKKKRGREGRNKEIVTVSKRKDMKSNVFGSS